VDFRTIGTNLATAIGTITVGSETLTATALLPNGVAKAALLVYPPEADLSYLMSGPSLNAHILWPVRLLRDPLSVPDRTAAVLDWMTALWPRPKSNYTLNVAGVLEAEAVSIRGAIDGFKYGDGAIFDLVEMMVDVHVYELAAFTP
jgi:hypothetical protein